MGIFGNYEVVSHLATGGMAKIFLAKEGGAQRRDESQLFVIKQLLPSLANREDCVAMFLDEARLSQRMRHPNVVRVLDIGHAESSYFFSMAYLRGKDLVAIRRRLWEQRQRLPLAQTLSIIVQMCAALEYAHNLRDDQGELFGVVHRDISPSNVFVTYDGIAKLLDFGVAKAEHRLARTKTGMTKGKLRYMSPEQALAKDLNHRSDIFSLSVVLWELTVGTRLFGQRSDLEVLRAIADADARRPSHVWPGYPPALEEIVMKGLARDPDARYQTAGAMQTAVERYAREEKLDLSIGSVRWVVSELFPDEMSAPPSLGQGGKDDDLGGAADPGPDVSYAEMVVDVESSARRESPGYEPTGVYYADTIVDQVAPVAIAPPALTDKVGSLCEESELSALDLSPNELYVLMQVLYGARSVADVVSACVMAEADVIEILVRHAQAGRISIADSTNER